MEDSAVLVAMHAQNLSQQCCKGAQTKATSPAPTRAKEGIFCHIAVKVWNRLSKHTVEVPNIETFKFGLGKEWENHPDKFKFNYSLTTVISLTTGSPINVQS